MLPKTCTTVTSKRRPWYQRLADRLGAVGDGKGRRLWKLRFGGYRMIYRDADRLDRAGDRSVRDPYLERFYIFSTPWFGVYIHRFWASDPDGLHDHPWSSFSWVLEGGYKEEIAGILGPEIRIAGSKHFRPAQEAHRVELCEGDEPGSCWTLFTRFRRKRLWGFYRGAEWIPAEKQSRTD